MTLKVEAIAIILTSVFIFVVPAGAASCDKKSATKIMSMMVPPIVQSVENDSGWIVVTFGNDYFSWTDRQTEGIVAAYANIDACISGKARQLEFRSPSGKLLGRADSLRGIQVK